ncbi:MAG: AAA family ATPase, partial [bacterium]
MRKLPVGHSDFKTVIEDNYYYVDKSLFIKELVDNGAQALLIPRPRRFGKTLNLSMLRYFFEKTEADLSRLFRHLKIWQAGEEYTGRQGKYPVIFLTFKDIKEQSWENSYAKIKQTIQQEYLRHRYLIAGRMFNSSDMEGFEEICNLKADRMGFASALKNLTHFLANYHQKKVIVLIDDYDTPLIAGCLNGYYDEVERFMGSLLSGGLKDDADLEKAVLTGRFWLAMVSILEGLNNLVAFTPIGHSFKDMFGLTEPEVKQTLKDFQVEIHEQVLNEWYNGYVFGDMKIFNPWSTVHYLNNLVEGPKTYWLNTLDTAFIKQTFIREKQDLRVELENI